MKLSKKDKIIRDNLVEQLARKNLDASYNVDAIDEYMTLVAIKRALENDIEERGTVYTDNSSVGVPMMKNNPSTKELVMVSKQLQALRKEFSLNEVVVDDGEDEL